MQRPDLSQGTEAVPEKQSRRIKGEAGGKAGGETRTGGRPASAPDAAGSIRSKHGCRAGVGTGRKQRSHQRDLAGDGGRCCLSIEICCCSVAQSCPTLCNLNCTMPGFPVLHYLLEFAQTHVH